MYMDKQSKQVKQRFPDHFYNGITYSGIMLSVFIIACELFLFAIDIFSPSSGGYLGILTYILLPPFLVIGLILIPVGAHWKQNQILRGLGDRKPKPIVIDLSF